jgi:uncharacterized sulfatase
MKPPESMQGHAFLGPHAAAPPEFMFGLRGRMDERYDMVRSVTDGRYIYVRNYMPHLPAGQHVQYMFVTPSTSVWKQLFDQGKLNDQQAAFWQRRPPEELYDLQNDPDEVNNLVGSPDHKDVLGKLRRAQQQHAIKTRDLGFLPESEIHRRAAGAAPYTYGHSDQYPLERIMAAAELASLLDPEAVPALKKAMRDEDCAVRYWGALGILMRGEAAVADSRTELLKALSDDAPTVRIAAAGALGQFGNEEDLQQALPVLLDLASHEDNGLFVGLMALNAIDYLDEKAAPALDRIKALPRDVKPQDRRRGYGIPAVMKKILADLNQ